MDRAHLSADSRRQHDGVHLPAGGAARLPRAGRPVREPDAASRRDPHHAHGAPLGHLGRAAFRGRQQHLYADQPDRARGTGQQERDSHRGVRARCGGCRQLDTARAPARRAAALEADPHDLLCLHHGRRALGAHARSGGRDAPCDGRRGLLRDARRDVLRPHADAALLSSRETSGGAAHQAGLGLRAFAPRDTLHLFVTMPMKHSINVSGLVALMLLLAACAVGPDYHAPRPLSGSLLNAHAAQGMRVEERPLEGLWWQQFDDPELDALMRRALSDNLDLQVARARVREARAAFRGSEYDLAPHVPATAGYQHSREQVPGFGTQRYDAVGYDAGFDASWEIDLFGHVRRSVEAARDDLDAERAALRGAQITVAAEVARNYFALRSTQQQIEVARHNLDNQRESVRITTVRYESGRGSELDVARSRARMQATEATLPALESAESAGRYRLAVLLGDRPGALDEELKPHPMPAYAKALPIGDAGADAGALLSRRPDVLEAERRLAGATARVGVATADLFPRVTVTGFVGFLSGDFSHLFSTSAGTDARAWSVSPT